MFESVPAASGVDWLSNTAASPRHALEHDAGQNLHDLAFVWGPLLGVPSTSVTAMEALLTSERKLPAKYPGRLGVRRRAVTNLSKQLGKKPFAS